jgi:hypothetical protein
MLYQTSASNSYYRLQTREREKILGHVLKISENAYLH